ncbi:hypothetical protein MVEN_02446300 [Mycena venus]|uniref:Uncharacterized protein n=1 Tax=Mycena venus TaxID=2733690 RepID=A0A8H7CBB2_9AGAR|nr:hypothetical protein MVEN_02446300 [Mycena venus]
MQSNVASLLPRITCERAIRYPLVYKQSRSTQIRILLCLIKPPPHQREHTSTSPRTSAKTFSSSTMVMNLDPAGSSIEKGDDETTISNLSSIDLSEPGLCCGFKALLPNLCRARQTERTPHLPLQTLNHSQPGQRPLPSTKPDPFGAFFLPGAAPQTTLGTPSFTNVPHTPNSNQHSLAGLTSATAKTWSASAATLVKQVLPRWPAFVQRR